MKPSSKKAPKNKERLRQYWLFKTEPEEHSWEMQKSRGRKGEPWTGVRNFVARNNMKAMQLGDLGFFYHTGEEKQVVGIYAVSNGLADDVASGNASTCAPCAMYPSP